MKHQHDGEPMPSVDDRTDVETVAFPKTGDEFENDGHDEELQGVRSSDSGDTSDCVRTFGSLDTATLLDHLP